MKLLLIAPHFFNYYKEIVTQAKSLNYEVDYFCDAPDNSNLFKALSRISRKLVYPKTKRYFNRDVLPTIKDNHYDKILLICGMSFTFSESMIKTIRELNKEARFIMYQWDVEKNIPYVKKIQKYADSIYSFELNDCYKNSDYRFIPNFYIPMYEEIAEKKANVYDASYIGTAHPKKLKEINMVTNKLESLSKNLYVYHYLPSILKFLYHKVFAKEYQGYSFSYFKKKALNKEEVKEVFSNSRCIIDASQGIQRGLTLRVIEALAAKRKVITTNKDIKKYDFYDANNIMVVEDGSVIDEEFFNTDFKDIDMSKYSLKNWLTTVLNEKEGNYLKKANKRILYICSRNFFKPVTGHEIKMFNYLKGMKKIFNADIDLYVFGEPNEKEDSIKDYVSDIYYAGEIKRKTKIKNLLFKSLLSWPIQTSLYYNKENFIKIKELSQDYHYDMVVVDMIRLEPYAKAIEYDCIKVMDIDDLLSKRYKRQLSKMNEHTGIAGAYEEKLTLISKELLKFNAIKKLVLKLEINRTKKAEKRVYEEFDYLLFVSKKEAEETNCYFNGDKAIAIGLGVDYSWFSKDIEVKKSVGCACFVGNMYYPPNADSLRYIVNEVLVRSRHLEKFNVIGSYPEELKQEFINNDKVCFLGRVEDIRKACKSAIVFLAPISYGTGIKTKILEALAMGMPVLTNSVGAEGIDVINGKDILIDDDALNQAKKLDELFENPDLCKMLSNNATRYAKEKLDWNIIIENFAKIDI